MVAGVVMLVVAAVLGAVWWHRREAEIAVWRVGYAAGAIGIPGLLLVVASLRY